ncbi:MAG: phosphatidylserine/phosphatidylglycerophosphate/cardiolipin synthase family protein [Vallitaleaceae bacterium]|jgi:cardiolipin synthase|nr:phosphatidylserine/phosphatidylglycerophosphate/cardiolipin synthase family protein [Vallitaleaceae bacterium]
MTMKLLVEGLAAFEYILNRVNHAQKSITINMFIWRNDRIGNDLAKALLDAADRGVKIKIVKDKLGGVFELAEETRLSFFNQQMDMVGKIKAKGIDYLYPMKGKSSSKPGKNHLLENLISHPGISLDVNRYIADHSKFYIIDDRILILGGINVEDKELYTDVEGKHYHDYMIGFEDEHMVSLFKDRFFGDQPCDGDRPVEFIFNRYNRGQLEKGAKDGLLAYLNKTVGKMDIVMAYLGDQTMTDKIIEMANNGIEVSLMLSAKANLQHDTNMRIAKHILKQTDNQVKLYLNPKMIHAKLISIDDQFLTFGSTNLNKQAMVNLGELNVCVKMDKAMASQLRDVIQTEKNASRFIESYEHIVYNKVRAFLEGPFC